MTKCVHNASVTSGSKIIWLAHADTHTLIWKGKIPLYKIACWKTKTKMMEHVISSRHMSFSRKVHLMPLSILQMKFGFIMCAYITIFRLMQVRSRFANWRSLTYGGHEKHWDARNCVNGHHQSKRVYTFAAAGPRPCRWRFQCSRVESHTTHGQEIWISIYNWAHYIYKKIQHGGGDLFHWKLTLFSLARSMKSNLLSTATVWSTGVSLIKLPILLRGIES